LPKLPVKSEFWVVVFTLPNIHNDVKDILVFFLYFLIDKNREKNKNLT
jgi:hypothetical protein